MERTGGGAAAAAAAAAGVQFQFATQILSTLEVPYANDRRRCEMKKRKEQYFPTASFLPSAP